MSLHFGFVWKWINWTNQGLDSNPNLREERTEHFQQLHLKAQVHTGRKTKVLFPVFRTDKSILP